MNDNPDPNSVGKAEGAGGKPRVAELTGKESGDFPDTPQRLKALRNAAIHHLKNLHDEMRADPAQAMDCPILGEKAYIRGRGIQEVKQFSGNPIKLRLIAGIRAIGARLQPYG